MEKRGVSGQRDLRYGPRSLSISFAVLASCFVCSKLVSSVEWFRVSAWLILVSVAGLV